MTWMTDDTYGHDHDVTFSNLILCYVKVSLFTGYLGGFDGNFVWNRIGAGKYQIMCEFRFGFLLW